MQKLTITTRKKREVIDITEQVSSVLRKKYADLTGICHLFILHTTAALTTADLDPGTDLDMLDAFEAMIPKLHYRHPHNPAHGAGSHSLRPDWHFIGITSEPGRPRSGYVAKSGFDGV